MSFVGVLALVCMKAGAQYDVHFTHYWELDNFYNPAAMNKNSRLNLTGAYSMQLVGYENAPRTMFFGASTRAPWGDDGRQSIGAGLLSDRIGLFTHNRLFLNYAYLFKVGGGTLNVGVQVGMLNESFRSDELRTVDSDDPAFPSGGERGKGVDIGAGVYYRYKILYVGLSGLHLTAPVLKYGKGNNVSAELKIQPAIYLQGGCNIQLGNPLLSVQPSLQASTDMGVFRVDITVRGTYRYQSNSFYGGLSYSPGKSVSFLLGGIIGSVRLGYAYEMFTNGVGWQTGSHDLVVNYQLDVDFFKKGKNVHKSVRYL